MHCMRVFENSIDTKLTSLCTKCFQVESFNHKVLILMYEAFWNFVFITDFFNCYIMLFLDSVVESRQFLL